MEEGNDGWLDDELAGCTLGDERLIKRLRKLLVQIGSAMGQSIPLVCQDWANAKAAYRFFSNDRVSEADILVGHFQATRERVVAADGPSWRGRSHDRRRNGRGCRQGAPSHRGQRQQR